MSEVKSKICRECSKVNLNHTGYYCSYYKKSLKDINTKPSFCTYNLQKLNEGG